MHINGVIAVVVSSLAKVGTIKGKFLSRCSICFVELMTQYKRRQRLTCVCINSLVQRPLVERKVLVRSLPVNSLHYLSDFYFKYLVSEHKIEFFFS